MNKTVPEFSNC